MLSDHRRRAAAFELATLGIGNEAARNLKRERENATGARCRTNWPLIEPAGEYAANLQHRRVHASPSLRRPAPTLLHTLRVRLLARYYMVNPLRLPTLRGPDNYISSVETKAASNTALSLQGGNAEYMPVGMRPHA